MPVASFLPPEDEPIGLERGDESAGGERSEEGKIHTHTVTATTGWSETVTLGGRDSPSSNSSSITIWATS